jgi:predicted short-subunit dehydrogenase-like oxidoreductase (DUF2520 family)
VNAHVPDSVGDAAARADLMFLTVPDDAIRLVVDELAQSDVNGKAVIHTSGAHEASVLSLLETCGAMIGSLHPVFPFADVEQSLEGLMGAVFGLQTESEKLDGWLIDIVTALEGQILRVGTGQKAVYHSAFVFASNYGVTLYAIAQNLLGQIGAEKEVSAQALNTLMMGMVRNLQTKGIPDALTGPLVRGDTGTVEAHLDALGQIDQALVDLYVQLARHTLPLVQARGVDTASVEAMLRKKMDDADNHT